MFMSGIFGKFVKEIPLAVVTCLGVSLLETYFILPGHVAHWIKKREHRTEVKNPGPVARFLERTREYWDKKVVPQYVRLLKLTLRFRYVVAALAFVLFWGSMFLAVKGMRFILFPPEGIEIFFVRLEAPNGYSLEQTSELTKPIEKIVSLLPREELDYYTTSIGVQQQDANDPFTKRGTERSQVQVFLTPENSRHRSASQIIDSLRTQIGHPENLKVSFERVNPGPPQGKPVSIGVRAPTYRQILPVVKDIKARLAQTKGVTDIADSFTLGKEEVIVKVQPEEAAAARLSVASIGNSVRASFEGIIATTVREIDEEMNVRVSLPKQERSDDTTLGEITVPNQLGNLIPISRVASFGKAQSLSAYEHEHFQRQVKVTAEVDTKVTTSMEANNALRKQLPELRAKYPGVGMAFGGEDEDTKESLDSLFKAFAYAVCAIYLILVLTFKQLLQPLIILITVPLGIISVIWAFFLHGLPLSFMAMVGIIALAGVIVNNAIVFVDFANTRRAEGATAMQSILDSASIRIRPIFLTTVTTVIGILPTAYGLGGLDKFVVPIAMALGWGLFFGSVLTALVFPATLAILDDFTGWLRRRFPKMTSLYDH
jgi:multidrug efflux pump subunit AcrB